MVTPLRGTLTDLAGRPILAGLVELISSDGGAPDLVVDASRSGPGGRFALAPRHDEPYFVRVIASSGHNGGYVGDRVFASLDPAGRDVWRPGDRVTARVGLTWMAGRMLDATTRRGVRGVLIQARTTGPAVAPTVATARGGLFVVRGLLGDLVDEEYTVCVDGTQVGYQAGQLHPGSRTVEGFSCADGLGNSASAGWLGTFTINRSP